MTTMAALAAIALAARPTVTGPVPPLVLWGDPVLEKPTEEITKFGEDGVLPILVANLKARLGTLKGYALAAPQIGIGKAVAVIRIPADTGRKAEEFVMVNPRITRRAKKVRLKEGCLSCPKFFHTINRFQRVTVTYQDEEGKHQLRNASGLLAQVIQHEVDHLEGRLLREYLHERQARRQAARCLEDARQ